MTISLEASRTVEVRYGALVEQQSLPVVPNATGGGDSLFMSMPKPAPEADEFRLRIGPAVTVRFREVDETAAGDSAVV
jgi:hypothetical protein